MSLLPLVLHAIVAVVLVVLATLFSSRALLARRAGLTGWPPLLYISAGVLLLALYVIGMGLRYAILIP